MDEAVKYIDGGKVFVTGHNMVSSDPIMYKSSSSSFHPELPFQTGQYSWVNEKNTLCLSWLYEDFNETDHDANHHQWFFKAGIAATHPYETTRRIACACMPNKNKIVSLEMEYHTNYLYVSVYSVSSDFVIERLSDRKVYDYGKALSPGYLNDNRWRIFGFVKHKLCRTVFLPSCFLTDAKTIIMLDKDVDANSKLVKIVFNTDYSSQTITEYPYSYSGESLVDMISFKNQIDFVSTDVSNLAPDGQSYNNSKRIVNFNDKFQFIQTGHSILTTTYDITRDYLYVNSKNKVFVYRYLEDNPTNDTAEQTIFIDIKGTVSQLAISSCPVTDNAISAYDWMYAVYDGKTVIVPINNIGNNGRQKTIIINKDGSFLWLDTSLEFFYTDGIEYAYYYPLSIAQKPKRIA